MSTFSVTNTNNSGSGSLRQAILDANALSGKDIINFDGVFADNIADTITLGGSSLVITDNLTINGTGENLLTVSGNNASRVFDITGDSTVEIAGLTIANGYLPDTTDYKYIEEYSGAGIRNYGALTLNDSIINGNKAGGNGGGIYNNGSLTVNNSTISNNTAGGNGGGIFNSDDSTNKVTVNNSIISGNSAVSYGGGIIGGSIINSIITNNLANSGAGLFGVNLVKNSTISGNRAEDKEGYEGGNGGGIAIATSVINSTISDNFASNQGGGIVAATSVINSTISDNFASNEGGGIAFATSVINSTISGNYGVGLYYVSFISNSTISGNSGGIDNGVGRGAYTQLTNSTVINNGYGIYSNDYSSGYTVNNSIIAGNSSDVIGDNFSSNGHNLIGNLGNSIGFDISEQLQIPLTDVLDTTLRNNGGLTQTHALVYGSPAINAGLNKNIPVDTQDIDGDGNTTEQIPFDGRGAGFGRISNAIVDIGAYEVQENVISGTAKNNTINGTAADDIITGYQGRDILSGGVGADAFVYTKISDLGDTISDFEVAHDKIVLKQLFESLNLGSLNFASATSGGYLSFESQGSDTVVLIDPDGSSGTGRAVKLVTLSNISTTAANNTANFVFAPPTITPSTNIFTVTNTNESGSGSLQQAIADANSSLGKDIIRFGDMFTDNIPDTILMDTKYLVIRDDLSIEAPGANLLTISGEIQIVDSATIEITGLTIANSTRDDYFGRGGIGIINYGTLTLNNSVVRDNGAGLYSGGGGIFNDTNATLTINNSTISHNYSYPSNGGGITNQGTLTINNSTISNNSSTNGNGGISNSGTLVINNSTITGNTSSNVYDSGVITAGVGGNAIVNNSIIAGNFYIPDDNPANTINADVSGNFISNGHNLIGNLGSSTGFNPNEQLTVPIQDVLDTTLRDNGGTVPTHALVPGSPAINAGLNADIPVDTSDLDGDGNTTEPAPFDGRGANFARVVDAQVDIGAYEGVANFINGTSNQDTINGTTGNDIITGFQRQDILSGGAGADEFVYTSLNDLGDTITDFQVGTDKISLKQLWTSLNLSYLDFTSAISGGYLSFETNGNDTIVLIDPDGSSGTGRAVKLITLNNLSTTAVNNPINFSF